MFYSYFLQSKNGWTFGNAQIDFVVKNMDDIKYVENLIKEDIEKNGDEVENIKIISFKEFEKNLKIF